MKKRVLIVDDSPTMRDMVEFTMRNGGFDVLVAEDGADALSVIDGERVDLVITDITMPRMDGIELVQVLRENPEFSSIPILCLTTEKGKDKKDAAKLAGATGWIEKPFEPDTLIEIANKVCR